jgi:hypothetical protein
MMTPASRTHATWEDEYQSLCLCNVMVQKVVRDIPVYRPSKAWQKRVMLSVGFKCLTAAVAVAALAGCAENGGPAATPLAPGQSCGSIKQELDRLDASGVRAKAEAAGQGKKLPPAQQAEVDRYNSLLNQYLGARCYV